VITPTKSPTTGRDVTSTPAVSDIYARMLASFSNAAVTVLVLGVLAGLAWVALRMDPHWVSKDGLRFTCRVQQVRQSGRVDGRWRDARCSIEGDHLRVAVRGLVGGPGRFALYHVIGSSDDPPPRRAVFVIRNTAASGVDDGLLLLRLPASSRAIQRLEAIAERG
jgi:hypothetical protein